MSKLLKLYQMNVVLVQLAFYDCVVMIHKIPPFPIKPAIFFPCRDLQDLRLPTALPDVVKLLCSQAQVHPGDWVWFC